MNSAAVEMEDTTSQPVDPILLVSVDQVIEYLNGDPPQETINLFYDFGKLVLDRARGLRESYDSKLLACLGWNSGLCALTLFGKDANGGSELVHLLALFGTVLAFLGVAVAALGLRSRGGWKWPSEKDWFSEKFRACPEKLKRHYIVAMLEAHASYNSGVQRKGYFMFGAELCLAGAAGFIALSAILNHLLLV